MRRPVHLERNPMSTNPDRPAGPTDATAPVTDGRHRPLSPHLQATLGTHVWGDFAGRTAAEIEDVARDLKSRAGAVHDGDLQTVEAALFGQAETLAMIFTNLHLRAQRSNNMESMRTLLTLALRAQAQSRATLETLVETKRPRQLLITRQANIAQHQMVNNGAGGATPARTETNTNAPIELLEEPNDHSLDACTARTPVEADSRVAALGEVDRATDARGEGRRVKKRVQGRPAAPDA